MKNAMNRRDIARYHAFLEDDLSVAKISDIMKIEIVTLNNFAPAKVAVSEDAKKKVAKKAIEKAEGKTSKPTKTSKPAE